MNPGNHPGDEPGATPGPDGPGHPREWLDGLDVVELDSAKLQALAHPTRSRILSSLRVEGPATSSLLADRLHTNSGQTSYHVRTLAEVGLVVEDADRGTTRERWWKAAQRGHSWSDPDDDATPEDRHAADWLLRHYHRQYTQWISEWHELRPEWPKAWRHAALSGDNFFMATPELLTEMGEELVELMQRYSDRGNDLDPDDPDVHPITTIYQAFPSDHLRP